MDNNSTKTTPTPIQVQHEYRRQYKRYSSHWTAYGRFMYNLTYNWGRLLNRPHLRWLAHLLNWTWGIITAVVGALLAIAALIAGITPHRWYGLTYFSLIDSWGGFEMGPFFFRDLTSGDDYINNHEWGHCFAQTTLLGPFMLLLVSAPSCARYWVQVYRDAHHKPNPDYDDIWFEACATDIGNDCIFDRRVAALDYSVFDRHQS